jgi:hypothetical protein
MGQYLELVLKRDFASGWTHTVKKVRLFFEKTSEVGPKTKTWEEDMKEKLGGWWW